MKRKKIDIARCTVERLMRQLGNQGVRRGKKIKTTHAQPTDQCPLDKVNRQVRASQPNALWVSDVTFVSSWRGFVYVAFVIDTFANRILGWSLPSAASATVMTTPWPRRSSAPSKPKSSIGWARGNPKIRSNGKPCNGWTGSTRTACLSRSVTSRQSKRSRNTNKP